MYCTVWVTVLPKFLSCCAVCDIELLDWDTVYSVSPSYSTELLYFLIYCPSHVLFDLLYVLSYCIFWVTASFTVPSELLSYWTELLYCQKYWNCCLSYCIFWVFELLFSLSFWVTRLSYSTVWVTGLSYLVAVLSELLTQFSLRFTVCFSILIYSTVWVTAVLTELLDRIN